MVSFSARHYWIWKNHFLNLEILLVLTTPSISHFSKIFKLFSTAILFSKLIYESLAELPWMWEQVWSDSILVISHTGVAVNRFPSDDELFELASHVLWSFLVNRESSEHNLIQVLCLCLLTEIALYKKYDAVLFLGRTLVFCLMWPLLLKLRNFTCGWNLKIMEISGKQRFFSPWNNFVIDVKFTVQYNILFFVHVSDFRFSCFSPCVWTFHVCCSRFQMLPGWLYCNILWCFTSKDIGP